MKFKGPRTAYMKENQESKYHQWFAWYPVRIDNSDGWVWLEYILRGRPRSYTSWRYTVYDPEIEGIEL